jgi:YVTN family beta-propeller protein
LLFLNNLEVVLKKNYIYPFSLTKSVVSLFIIVAAFSCSKNPVREETTIVTPPPVNTSYQNGIFVVNEGNYNWGNASITFINTQDTTVEQDVFKNHNDRSLGDVAESMLAFNGQGFILVNNSNKIEVVSLKDFSSVKSMTGFNSPRFLAVVDSSKAYVTNMRTDISVIDLPTLTVTKTINTGCWTESILKYDNLIYVTAIGMMTEPSSHRNARILIIDTKLDQIVDSIKTGKEPMGMVMDKKDKIWVLCTGGYDQFEPPTLIRIDPSLRIIDKVFTFPGTSATPSRLCINSNKDTLYFLNNGIYQMPVVSSSIPSSPFIPAGQHLFYGLGIQPSNGNIFVSDAKDYVQNGVVYQYNQVTGSLLNTFPAGRIPGSFCFTSGSKKK